MKLKFFYLLALSLITLNIYSCNEESIYENETEEETEDQTDNDSDEEDENDEDNTQNIVYPEEDNSIKYVSTHEFKRTIYIDDENGSDNNDGLSEENAIKTLNKLSEMNISNGDQILLKGGHSYKGNIILKDLNKNAADNNYIHIGSYGDSKAEIDFRGYPQGILVENTSRVEISDIRITANGGESDYMINQVDKNKLYRYGIFINSYGKDNKKNISLVKDITISNVNLCDIFYYNNWETPPSRPCKEWSTNNEQKYGWGIRALVQNGYGVDGIDISDCYIRNISHTGIKMNASNVNTAPVKNVSISRCQIYEVGGPGSQFGRVSNLKMSGCTTKNSGSRNDPRKWGRGSGMWCHTCKDLLFENNTFEGAEGIADCCGAHIDIGNENIVIQYCFSKGNAGGFIEVLGENKNCSYRYNISVDDGWRNLSDEIQKPYWGNIGTKGCIMTINGHTTKEFVGPYYTYIYNNTIVWTENLKYKNPFIFEMATSATGILVMNNIFWVPERMNTTWSEHSYDNGTFINNAFDFKVADQVNAQGKPIVRDMTEEEINKLNFVVKNNLYKIYNNSFNDILPEKYWDEKPLKGNPQFVNATGIKPEDFVPQNSNLINSGMSIPKLESDNTAYGIKLGLTVSKDFFGNDISTPIIGAVIPR